MAADRASPAFTSRWIDHLIGSVSPNPHPDVRSGYVSMDPSAWHEVSVLKFVNQYFILDRPDLAMLQRGQGADCRTPRAGVRRVAFRPDRRGSGAAPSG